MALGYLAKWDNTSSTSRDTKNGYESRQDHKQGLTLIQYHCKGLTLDQWKSLNFETCVKIMAELRQGHRVKLEDRDGHSRFHF